MTQLLLEKLLREKDPASLEPLLKHQVRGDAAKDRILIDLITYFEHLYKELKNRKLDDAWSLSKLVEPFQIVADSKGIGAEEFYPHLVDRLFGNEDVSDAVKTGQGLSTKERILAAALEIFSEKGFHLATVEMIAERAGVGKGTLYRHFSNKETLFNEVVNTRLQELGRKAEDVLDGQDDVLTLIRKYMKIYLEFFDQNQQFYRVMVQEQLDFKNRVQDLYVEKIMRRVPLLKKETSRARQRNILKDVDFQTVFYGVIGFMHGVIQNWLAHDCSYSLLEELPTVEQVLFYGFVHADRQES